MRAYKRPAQLPTPAFKLELLIDTVHKFQGDERGGDALLGLQRLPLKHIFGITWPKICKRLRRSSALCG
jgi:hypothetical protein